MPRTTKSMPCPRGDCPGITTVESSTLSRDKLYRLRRRKCNLCGSMRTTSERWLGPIKLAKSIKVVTSKRRKDGQFASGKSVPGESHS